MRHRSRAEWAGYGVVAVIMVGVGIAFLSLAAAVPGHADPSRPVWDPYLRRVLVFTVWQAALSTLLSVGLAGPLARALARRSQFAGRAMLLRLMSLPTVLPALVGVLGIVTVWGRAGWLNGLLQSLGAQGRIDIYGLCGILIGHVFFNLPLAARMLLSRLEATPGDSWRLASQLGMSGSDVFRHIEWPVIRAALPGIASIVFLLCATSFTIVLTLGGGPAASTIEVAIYQALRFDFEPVRAVWLALTQIGLSLVLIMAGAQFAVPVSVAMSTGRSAQRPDLGERGGRIMDALAIGAAACFTGLPLVATLIAGLQSPLARVLGQTVLWQALATSLIIAASASLLALLMAGTLVAAARAARQRSARPVALLLSRAGSVILVVPPMALGAGWFMALHRFGELSLLAPLLVVAINALMALPYGVQIVGSAVEATARDHDRLCAGLGLAGWQRFRLVDWPMLRRPAGLALALAAALSLGDLGVISLFGSEKLMTLPLLLQQRMGSYRVTDAAGIALLLGLVCVAILTCAERLTAATWRARP